jgi:hypothetical protein
MRITGWLAELALAVIVIVIVASAGRAGADPDADPNADPQIEKADQLFAEGKALLASNLIQACDRFDASLRYNSAAIGTLLNVALCHEKLGRFASAVARFSEARDRAKEQGLPEHVRAAEDHIAALAPSVPHLAIRLTQALPETKVLVDDRLVALDTLADVAVDPGERVLVVGAPDRLPYRVTLVIGKAERRTVAVPALARSVTVTSSWRRIGQIATATGGAAFLVSVGLALYGRDLHQQQFDDGHCTHRADLGIDLCDTIGQPRIDKARAYGNTATVVGSVGLALAAAGAGLWIFAPHGAPRDTAPRLAVVPAVTGDGFGVTALGRF